MMEIRQYIWNAVDANSWLITEGNDGLLIDAVENQELYKTVSNLSTLTIILTHCHFDHIIGLNKIREIQPETHVISTKLCSEYISNKFRNMSSIAAAFMAFYKEGKNKGIKIESFTCAPADEAFEEEKRLSWKEHDILLSAFHGHSKDSLIAIIDERCMFSGDTLLSIPTVTRLPGGNTKRFREEDIPRLKKLNVNTVYPGHGMPGSIKKMLYTNIIDNNLTI